MNIYMNQIGNTMWKLLGNNDGHGFGYVEYWDFGETYPHSEHPTEIIDEHIEYMDEDSKMVSTYHTNNYIYVIHHVHDETYNYFRYKRG